MRRFVDAEVVRGAHGEVSLSGADEALRTLGSLLRSGVDTELELRTVTPRPPYVAAADSIGISVDESAKVLVAWEGERLTFTGGVEALALLGGNISSHADELALPGAHAHIEWFPGHFFLREGSEPMVVSRRPKT